MKVSFRIERFQFGSWTIVRLNIATKETAEAEAAAMKSESTLPLQIVKVTEEVIGITVPQDYIEELARKRVKEIFEKLVNEAFSKESAK